MVGQAVLEITNDGAEKTRREKSRSQRAGHIFTHGRQPSQRRSDRCRHSPKLPANLVADSLRPVRSGKSSRLRGIRGGTQGVGAHMRDACGLPGRPGGRYRGRSAYLTRSRSANKSATDLRCGAELAASKGPCPGDGSAGAAIFRSFRLEQPQHPLRAVRRPHGDEPPVSFAERLWRAHTPIFTHVRVQGPPTSDRPTGRIERLAQRLPRPQSTGPSRYRLVRSWQQAPRSSRRQLRRLSPKP